jgi:glucose/arabinose dehydrogenase
MARSRLPALYPAALALAIAIIAGGPAAQAQIVRSEAHDFRLVRLVEGLEHPWGLAFLPDGRMLVTERPGRLRVVGKDHKLDAEPVAGLPAITPHGQGGLMDVATHPRFAENSLVYVSYAARGEGGVSTEVARGRLSGRRLEDLLVLFRQLPKSGGGRHFAARVRPRRIPLCHAGRPRGDGARAETRRSCWLRDPAT